MSRPSPRSVAPPPCLPLDIKDSLKKDREFRLRDWLKIGGGLIDWLTAGCYEVPTVTAAAGHCVSPPEQLSALRILYIGFKKAILKKS
jgi:hypothetical protein